MKKTQLQLISDTHGLITTIDDTNKNLKILYNKLKKYNQLELIKYFNIDSKNILGLKIVLI